MTNGNWQPAVKLDDTSLGTIRSKRQSNGASQLHWRDANVVTRGSGDMEGAAGIMATTTKSTKVAGKTSRYNELKKMLEERRRELLSEVQGKIRDVRAESGKERDVLDQGESSEVDIQEDIEFALIQINEALRRLEEGTYGNCFECGEEIAGPRLRALPFAVRCKDCEEERET